MPKTPPQLRPRSGVDDTQVNRDSRRKLLLVMAGFAVAAFLVTELMHYLLVPDLGPHRERIMAEAGSALILGMLAAKLLHNAYSARQHALARLRVIAELNHHVRNALEVISLSAYITRDEQAIRRIMEGVNRIDWALREILPRESFPVPPGEPPALAGDLPATSTASVRGHTGAEGDSCAPRGPLSHSPAPGAAARTAL